MEGQNGSGYEIPFAEESWKKLVSGTRTWTTGVLHALKSPRWSPIQVPTHLPTTNGDGEDPSNTFPAVVEMAEQTKVSPTSPTPRSAVNPSTCFLLEPTLLIPERLHLYVRRPLSQTSSADSYGFCLGDGRKLRCLAIQCIAGLLIIACSIWGRRGTSLPISPKREVEQRV